MHGSHERILAGCQLVQLGVFQIKIALAHGAFHIGDGVAHHAAESCLRLGAMHDLLDRCVHEAAIENGGIVASAAPF